MNARRAVCLVGLQPAGRAQAPAITVFQAGETELRARRAQVVAAGLAEFQETLGQHRADGVYASILRSRLAAAGAVEAGLRVVGAVGQLGTEYVQTSGFVHSVFSVRMELQSPRITPIVRRAVRNFSLCIRRWSSFGSAGIHSHWHSDHPGR